MSRPSVFNHLGAKYAKLWRIYVEAVRHASEGKGHERHATDDPFDEQPIVKVGEWLGSNHYELGQAVKKCIESTRLSPAAARHELLGAMNYIAAAVLIIDRGTKGD